MHENNDNEPKITLGGVISSSLCWSNDVVFRWWFSMRDSKNRMNSWKIRSNQFRQILGGVVNLTLFYNKDMYSFSKNFVCSMVSIKISLHLRTLYVWKYFPKQFECLLSPLDSLLAIIAIFSMFQPNLNKSRNEYNLHSANPLSPKP